MKKTFGDALRHASEVTGRSLHSIAVDAGVSYDTLKNLSQGKAKRTNFEYAQKIVDVFGVGIDDFLSGNLTNERITIAVAGRVGAGAQVPLIDAYEKGDGLYHVEAPPQLKCTGPHTGYVAVEVEGDSMQPMYQPGDVLFYSRATHEGIASEDIGRPCVVEDAAGQAWVKLVKRGDEPGLFHLISLNPTSETRHNQRIKWASRVRLALPKDMVGRS